MSEHEHCLIDIEKLINLCKSHGIRKFTKGDFEAEFFPTSPEPMKLDPLSLSKVLSDSMPPDSAMMFAAVDDPNPENPISSSRENDNMP